MASDADFDACSDACESERNESESAVSESGTRRNAAARNKGPDRDDEKKLGVGTWYEGFSIYGRILCLVVKRRGATKAVSAGGAASTSQAMLENWVSTQAVADAPDDYEDDEEDGAGGA